jgi:hypothetical protein
MKLSKTLASLVALGVLGVFTANGFAQQPEPEQQAPQQGQRQRTDDSILTGCLAKGTTTGQFILTDRAGRKTSVTGEAGVELEKHAANSTVRLTGSRAADGTFAASKIEHVSATCEAR